jgi:hypothetical protein
MLDAIVEVRRAVGKAALGEERELEAYAIWEGRLAAADDDGRKQQVDLVDQPGPERMGGEAGAADGDVAL